MSLQKQQPAVHRRINNEFAETTTANGGAFKKKISRERTDIRSCEAALSCAQIDSAASVCVSSRPLKSARSALSYDAPVSCF
jgi:hypothetical protein